MQTLNKKYLIVVALVLVTLAVFWPALNHDFINYDDPEYVTGNDSVKTGLSFGNIRWAFTTTLMGNWNPVTWISHMADCEIYGLNPRGHHLTNIILHGLNAALLFILLSKMTGTLWRSAFVAAIFALHPLRVESVAWVSERKDVLSAFFFMTTLMAYVFYIPKSGIARYLLILVSFILGLMAKPMLVTLPFVLLLLDYWPLDRLKPGRLGSQSSPSKLMGAPPSGGTPVVRLLSEKIPLFIIAAVFSGIAVYSQSSAKAIKSVPDYPLLSRFSNAMIAYVTYIWKTFWPQDLAALYPLPGHVPIPGAVAAFAFLTGMSLLSLRVSKRSPFVLVGWLWFMGTLVPVIGLIQVGLQAMADRYTYIPSIGLLILVVWGAAEMTRKWRYRFQIVGVSAFVICILLISATRNQLKYWENSIALFTHAIKVTDRNYVAHANLGDALDKNGRYDEAMQQYREALKIKPDEAFVYYKLANDLDIVGRLDDAVMYYEKSLQIDPRNARVHSNFGVALIRKGDTAGAKKQFVEAIELDPKFGDAYYNLGLALASEGNLQGAIRQYSVALQLNPADSEIRLSLDKALAELAGKSGAQTHGP